jgi:hypothetical protein
MTRKETFNEKIERFGLKENIARYGLFRALVRALDGVLNTYFRFDRLYIILLERESLKPLSKNVDHLSSRFATYEELLQLRQDPKWERAISDELMRCYEEGDRCLLSFCDDQLAGFTWVHRAGRPRILPGLRIRIPDQYVYNHNGYTLSEFRGHGLQPYRHSALMNHPDLANRTGLMGFVKFTNWSSQKGQGKSGYRTIGSLWLVGTKRMFVAFLSPRLQKMGIRRVPDTVLESSTSNPERIHSNS